MSNPFKKTTDNANKSKKIYGSEREKSETNTRKCEGCGAVRPADTDLTTCDYCGYKFMDIRNEVRLDDKE